jgi:hypothetical protein
MGKEIKNTNIKKLDITSELMDSIEKAIRETLHGSITLIVQDSCVVQIEKQEKIKLC